MNKYDDIINIPHYEPKYHQRISISNRAMQFSPFAALVGFDDIINDSNMELIKKKELSDIDKDNINNKLIYIDNNINKLDKIKIIYFKKYNNKELGIYHEYIGKVKKIDLIYKYILFTSNKKILFSDIIDIIID